MSLDKMADDFVTRQMQPDFAAMTIVSSTPGNTTALKSVKAVAPDMPTNMSTVTADNAISSFVNQLTSYIPAEILGAYVAILALIPAPSWVTASGDADMSKVVGDVAAGAAKAAAAANIAAASAANAAHVATHSAAANAAGQAAASAAQAAKAAADSVVSATQTTSALMPADSAIDFWLWTSFVICLILAPTLQYFLIAAKVHALGHKVGDESVNKPFFPVLASVIAFVAWSIYLPHSIVAHTLHISPYGGGALVIIVSLIIYAFNAGLNAFDLAPTPPPAPVLPANALAPQIKTQVFKSTSGVTISPFPVPPQGFDAVTATADDLAKYGFPPRPSEPQLLDRWKTLFGGSARFIEPLFLEDDMTRSSPRIVGAADDHNWSGAVAYTAAGTTFTDVCAQWIVPNVEPVKRDGTEYHAMFWVGIDGDGGSFDVLQAGVHCIASYQDNALQSEIAFFCEWAPAFANPITNLAVSAGDRVSCYITALDRKRAKVFLSNLTTNTKLPFMLITPPVGTALKGNSAEWIAERPQVDHTDSLLANYHEVVFEKCSASTSAGSSVQLQRGDEVNMELTRPDGSKYVVSEAAVKTASSVSCRYNA